MEYSHSPLPPLEKSVEKRIPGGIRCAHADGPEGNLCNEERGRERDAETNFLKGGRLFETEVPLSSQYQQHPSFFPLHFFLPISLSFFYIYIYIYPSSCKRIERKGRDSFGLLRQNKKLREGKSLRRRGAAFNELQRVNNGRVK